MRYLLAIILPPLAVAFSGGFLTFVANCFLTLLFWIPGAIHAILVVNKYYADQRTNALIYAMQRR